jgi:hypothetical protein
MKAILISITALFLGTIFSPGGIASPAPTTAQTLIYTNRGDNMAGFILKFNDANFGLDNHMLLGTWGSGWYALPVYLTGDFRIDFDVYPDSNDASSYLILFDESTGKGINVANSTNTSFGLHSLEINSVANLTDHDKFFFDHQTLATAEAKKFPDKAWTHVTIIKKGNTLTDNVGGQIISADLSPAKLPPTLRLGLGYYASDNVGGDGQIGYGHIRVVRLNQ